MTTEGQRAAVRRISEGDIRPLGDLYQHHAGRLRATGLRVLGSLLETEDLLHDVFLEAWRNAASYEPTRGSVGTWLLVRMRSRAWDRRRELARRWRLKGPDAACAISDREAAPGAAGPESVVLRDALRALPGSQRVVVELAYFGDLSATEIATHLGIPTGTVKSRIAAGLRQLRRALGAECA